MIDRLERLLNLVIALRHTRRPMTAEEIRERVAGYGQPDHATFRRMFERDKADLRALGVPLETAPADRLGEGHGYRIDPRRAELPPLPLSAEEVTALAVAAEITGVADMAGAGLRKLEVDADAPGAAGDAERPRIALPLEPSRLSRLLAAQRGQIPLRFTYRRRDGLESDRLVDPHGVVHVGGRWYLVGFDHDRGASRSFRIDRIVGEIHDAGEAGSASQTAEGVDVDAVLPPRASARTAEVAARGAAVEAVAAAAVDSGHDLGHGWTRFAVRFDDAERLAGWALAAAPDVVVIAPEEAAATFDRAAARLAEVREGRP